MARVRIEDLAVPASALSAQQMKGVFGGLVSAFTNNTPILNPGGLRSCWSMSADPKESILNLGGAISNPGGTVSCWSMSADPASMPSGDIVSRPQSTMR